MKKQQPTCGLPQRTMERLEDRILFDAVPDGVVLFPADVPPDSPPLPPGLPEQSEELHQPEQPQQADGTRELILVDANVADANALLNKLLQSREGSSFEVRLLDANSDGVAQIGSILSSQEDAPYSAVHILSHGGDGMLQLGSTVLSDQNFSKHSTGIRSWSQGLRASGDVLFYGCDLASGQIGQELLTNLQQAIGADVAASSDLTGHRDLGGDWDLEFQIGQIETEEVSVRDYFNTLNVFTIQADTPVTVDGDGGVGTTGKWSNAGFVDTDSTVDADGDGDFENDADMAVDVVATVIGVTGTASVDFQTVSTTDPLRDDMRARISGDGTATIRWEIFEAGKINKPTEGKIGLTISDIDGSGGPETVEGVAASLHNLSSYTLQSPTNLDIEIEDNFLVAQGTQNQNDERPSWVRFDWATANELVLTYYVYGNGTRFFNHDGDGDLVFTNPNTNFTQGIDLDTDDSSGASGSNYQATYIDGSIPGVDNDVPVSVADADIRIFDLNDTTLQGATIVLTNASAGDQLNVNAPLLVALGISANVDSSDPTRVVVTLSGSSLIENYQTAIKSVKYSNVNATFDKSYHRVVEIFATDGTNVSGTANTTINFSNAVNAPTAAADFYVTSEDAGGLSIDEANGLLANDDDPQGDSITVIGARDSGGNLLILDSIHTLPSGSTILLRADGSFDYTPAAHFSGAEFINYDISDAGGNTATSFLTINTKPIADVPVLSTSYTATTVNEDEWSAQLYVSIATPDSDGSETLKLVVSGIPAGASITDGTNTFVAGATSSVDVSSWDLTRLQFRAASHSDVDHVLTLTLTSSEANGDSQTVSQLVRFAVDAVADAPTVSTADAQGAVDQTVSLVGLINVALVDQDGSEEITSVTISNIPAGAQLLDNGVPLAINAGQVTLTVSQLANLAFGPPASVTGTYTLRVSATSEETTPENIVATRSATSTPVDLVITIDNVDDPVTTHKDIGLVANNSTVTLAVLSNDEIPDGGGQVTLVDGRAISIGQTITLSSGAGTVTLNSDQSLSFTAASSTSGTVELTYRAEDMDGDFSIGTAYVSVAAPLVNDTSSTKEDTSVAIDVLGNDSTSVLPSTITSQTATDGTNGTTTINSDGTITYSPNADFNGSDSFTYTVTGLAAGLQYQFFDGLGSWNSLDDIPTIDPDYIGIATDLDSAGLANSLTGSNTNYGVRYYGKLYVENADSYEFSLNSNNGSRIWINGSLVTDNNNSGGTTSNVGSVFLHSGYHDIRIEHYDFGGAAGLIARMSGADTSGVSTNLLASGRIGSMVVTQSATVNITVASVNDAPTAADDDLAATENQSLSGNVITDNNGNGADNDPDGDALTVGAVDGSAANVGSNTAGSNGGTFNISSDGTYSFTPGTSFDLLAAGETTKTSLTYTISDEQGRNSTATVEVTVTGTNDAPTVLGSIPTQSGQDGTTISPLDVSGYFDDLDATNTLTFSAGTTLPPGLSINSGGVISGTIVANASVTGPFTVTITASDGTALISQDFTWNVTNPAPFAQDDSVALDEDTQVTASVAGNDSDPDSDALTFSKRTNPANGTLVFQSNGTYTYTPDTDFNGSDRFTYQVRDADGTSSIATVHVTVNPINDAPVVASAIGNRASSDGDVISLELASFFSDVDGDSLDFSATGLPDGLSISSSGVITGTISNSASQAGPFSVTISVKDPSGESGSQSFQWSVSNRAPIATDDSFSAIEDTLLTGDISAGDSDPDGDTISFQVLTGPSHGTLILQADGTFTYSPTRNYHGSDSFLYQVHDADGATSSATVSITVNSVNDLPTYDGKIMTQTSQDGETVNLDLSSHFADIEGPLVFSATGLPPRLSMDLAGRITGMIDSSASASGPYSVQVTAQDSNSATVTATFEWQVTNPAPNAVGDSYATNEDNPVSGNVGDNDTDADGDSLTFTLLTGPSNASLLFHRNGSFVYTPNSNYSGVDSFVYQVQDSDGATATATAVITVGDVNDPPSFDTPLADQANWDGDLINMDVSVHFSDIDGNSLSFSATGLPPGVTLRSNGMLTGTLVSNASQGSPYTVIVAANDGNGGTVSDTFEWTVQNPSPVAQEDTGSLNEDTSYWGEVSTNDNDPDSDSVIFTKLTDPPNGSVVFFSDGRYQYTGDDNFQGSDSFTYQVQDADGAISTATVHITVLPVNDAPDQRSNLLDQSSSDGDSVLIDLRPAFQDIDGDTLTFSVSALPPGLSLDPSGIIQGTLASHASAGGPYLIKVTVSDSNGGSIQARFTWDIANPEPTATNNHTTSDENQAVSGNVITDDSGSGVDSDLDHDTMQVSALNGQAVLATGEVTGSNGGRFVVSANGSYLFYPRTDFDYLAVGESINTSIQYTLRDAQGATSTATLAITVSGTNDAPRAYSSLPHREHAEGTQVAVNLGNWFGDPDQSDHTSFEITGLPPGLTADPSTGLIAGALAEGSSQDFPYTVQVTVRDVHGAAVTRNFQWRVTPTFAFDAFNNQAELQQRIGMATQREVLLSQRIDSLVSEPILAGSAQAGAILVARIYAADGSILGEVSTQADQAGNWSLQFFGVAASQQTRIIIEHVASEHSLIGEADFRLGEETYRSLQLDAMHRNAPTAWSILSDAPAAALEQMHRENKNPLSFL